MSAGLVAPHLPPVHATPPKGAILGAPVERPQGKPAEEPVPSFEIIVLPPPPEPAAFNGVIGIGPAPHPVWIGPSEAIEPSEEIPPIIQTTVMATSFAITPPLTLPPVAPPPEEAPPGIDLASFELIVSFGPPSTAVEHGEDEDPPFNLAQGPLSVQLLTEPSELGARKDDESASPAEIELPQPAPRPAYRYVLAYPRDPLPFRHAASPPPSEPLFVDRVLQVVTWPFRTLSEPFRD